MLCYMGMSGSLVPMMVSFGTPQTAAMAVLQYAAILTCVGSILSGIIDKKIGSRKMSYICIGIQVLSCLAFVVTPNGATVGFVIGGILLNCMAGMPSNLIGSTTMDKSTPAHFAAVYPIIIAVFSIIKAFGSSVVGLSLDTLGSYRPATIIFLAFSVLAIALIVLSGNKVEPAPEVKTDEN